MSYSAVGLAVSVLLCGVITYSLAGMFGLGAKNEFVVDGRVRLSCSIHFSVNYANYSAI